MRVCDLVFCWLHTIGSLCSAGVCQCFLRLIQQETCACRHVSVCLLTCQSSVVLAVWIAVVHSAVSQTALLCFAHVYTEDVSQPSELLAWVFFFLRHCKNILSGITNNAPMMPKMSFSWNVKGSDFILLEFYF